MNNKIMNFGGHIKELRRRVVWVSYIVVLGISIGLIFAGKVIHYLKVTPPASGMALNAFSPWYFILCQLLRVKLALTKPISILSFMFNIVIPISVLFELPVIMMFLTKIKILNPKKLYKMRRYAYYFLFIIAATITPPDVLKDVIVTIPLFILYEFSVFLSYLVFRKQLAKSLTD